MRHTILPLPSPNKRLKGGTQQRKQALSLSPTPCPSGYSTHFFVHMRNLKRHHTPLPSTRPEKNLLAKLVAGNFTGNVH